MNIDTSPNSGFPAAAPSLSTGRSVSASASPASPEPAAAPQPQKNVGIDQERQSATRSEAAQEQAKEAATQSNAKLAKAGVPLQFQVELNNDGAVRSFKLFDAQTNQVVMQIPSEAMVAIRDSIDQMIAEDAKVGSIAGALFSREA